MERYIYVKVLLYAYPELEALADAVSEGADNKAFLSFRNDSDTLRLAETIAEEIATAQKLRLLKAELDGVILSLGEEERYLLEYKYFRRKSELNGTFAGTVLPCCERSYFRRQNALLEKMAGLLSEIGRTERDFFRNYSGFRPFMRVYRALADGRERKVVYKRKRRELRIRGTV